MLLVAVFGLLGPRPSGPAGLGALALLVVVALGIWLGFRPRLGPGLPWCAGDGARDARVEPRPRPAALASLARARGHRRAHGRRPGGDGVPGHPGLPERRALRGGRTPAADRVAVRAPRAATARASRARARAEPGNRGRDAPPGGRGGRVALGRRRPGLRGLVGQRAGRGGRLFGGRDPGCAGGGHQPLRPEPALPGRHRTATAAPPRRAVADLPRDHHRGHGRAAGAPREPPPGLRGPARGARSTCTSARTSRPCPSSLPRDPYSALYRTSPGRFVRAQPLALLAYDRSSTPVFSSAERPPTLGPEILALVARSPQGFWTTLPVESGPAETFVFSDEALGLRHRFPALDRRGLRRRSARGRRGPHPARRRSCSWP